MAALLSIALAVLIGVLVVRLLDPAPGLEPRGARVLMELGLGAGVGVGVTSFLYFLLLLTGLATPAAIWAIELLLAGGLAATIVILRRRLAPPRGPDSVPDKPAGFRWNWILAVGLFAGLLLTGSILTDFAAASPNGDWDAWSIWNVRAKFLAGSGDAWKNAVSPLLERTHPGYPLLLSGFIARSWRASGAAPTSLPHQTTTFLFAAAALSVLMGVLWLLRGLTFALLAGLLMLASYWYLLQIPAQYADLAVSLYYLGTLTTVILAGLWEPPRTNALLLAGFLASLSAWTKNEGLVFVLLALGTGFALRWRMAGLRSGLRQTTRFLLGALPGIILILAFKLLLAPAADPLLRQTAGQAIQKLEDFSRYAMVAKALASGVGDMGQLVTHPLLLMAILLFALRWSFSPPLRPGLIFGVTVLGLTFAAYCVVYLVTPADLTWQLGTSLGRLYAQLWPAALLLMFLILGRTDPGMEESKVPVGVGSPPRRDSAKRRKKGNR